MLVMTGSSDLTTRDLKVGLVAQRVSRYGVATCSASGLCNVFRFQESLERALDAR